VHTDDADGETAAFAAAARGHTEVLAYLTEQAGADLGQPNLAGWTPFSAACRFGQLPVVHYLHGRLRREQVTGPAQIYLVYRTLH
jgi:ankyrin repeat protein